MALAAITHWYKVGNDVYEALCLKPQTADAEIAAHGLVYCKPCGALVKPGVRYRGIKRLGLSCPFCHAVLTVDGKGEKVNDA